MTKLTLVVPTVGEFNTIAEPKVDTCFTEIQSFINGKNLDGTDNIKAEGVEEANLTEAVQIKLNQKSAGLELVKQNGSTTGESGKLYYMEKAASTLTLPAATSGRQVGIFAAAEGVKVKTAAGAIFGDFLPALGAAEITLVLNQHVILEATGTNWIVVAGKPALPAYTARVEGSNFTPASDAFVIARMTYETGKGEGTWALKVGAVEVASGNKEQPTVNSTESISFLCPGGVEWKITSSGAVTKVIWSQLLCL